MLIQPFNLSQIVIPNVDILTLFSQCQGKFIFIKNGFTEYQYANPLFLELMGRKELKQIYGERDQSLCRDKQKVKRYKELDEEVLDTQSPVDACEEVMPLGNEKTTKRMAGKLYPIYYNDESAPSLILGIVQPVYSFKLNLDLATTLSTAEIDQLLTRRSYKVSLSDRQINLSKREVQCIIECIKGKHAGKIAQTLSLQQTSIEFYFENIKNKLGASDKGEMIEMIFKEKLLQQLIL